jgi:LysM repeat protein
VARNFSSGEKLLHWHFLGENIGVAVAAPIPRLLVVTAAALALSTPAATSANTQSGRAHAVRPGESLWQIARNYGCDVANLKDSNQLDSNVIYPGTSLALPESCGQDGRGVRPGAGMTHRVDAGDTLYGIAVTYDTTVADIQARNQLRGTVIYPGQVLRIQPGAGAAGRPIVGQSVGRSHDGLLRGGVLLAAGRGYHVRRPHRAFGASHMVHLVRRTLAAVRQRFPRHHVLAIGDLSAREGGKIPEHRSHQSGRDIDIGLYYRRQPRRYPQEFVRATPQNLDPAATWALLEGFAATYDRDGGVERIFLGYETQELLHRWAEANGVRQDTLRRLLQYPRGRDTPVGLVRDFPGHNDHMHVRFKCPAADHGCR